MRLATCVLSIAAAILTSTAAGKDVLLAGGIHLRDGGTVGPAAAPLACVKPVVAPALPASQVQHLGVHSVGEALSFDVKPRTGTISIVQQLVGDAPETITLFSSFAIPNAPVPLLLTAPDGTTYYDDNVAFFGAGAHAVVNPSAAVTGVMTLPATTQAFLDRQAPRGDSGAAIGYPVGTWSMVVNDFALECMLLPAICSGGAAGDRYDVTVVTKDVAGGSGALDVGVYLATETLTSAQAVAGSSMQRFATTLATVYAQVGIPVRNVTVYDLPPWAKTRYATGVDASDLGPCSDFGQLFTLSQPGRELPLFMVDAIEFAGSDIGEIVGIDGSIPGPAAMNGTVVSGAVANVSDLMLGTCGAQIDFGNCGADVVAYIGAHEGGHYMGLFHTTEAFGNAFDPLVDTPRCQCSTACVTPAQANACANFAFFLDAATCTQTTTSPCGGGDNLMFWLLQPPISRGKLTAEQGKVMLANPVVQ